MDKQDRRSVAMVEKEQRGRCIGRKVQADALRDQKRIPGSTVEPFPSMMMRLRGLGKEIWAEIDAQDYVDEERSSWDG